MNTFNVPLATDIVLNDDYTSSYVPLKNTFMYSMAAIFTGTPTGSIKLQASNDPENPPGPLNPTNWVDIANSTFNISSSGETMWNVSSVAYNYVRVVYTDGSGGASTATMDLIFNGKGA